MSWVFLDDRFFTNRKVMSVSLHARWLYLSSLCVASQQSTDGLLDEAAQTCLMVAVGRSGSFDQLAAELVRAGLWLDGGEGAYYIHDYLEYQPSAEDQRKQRAKNAERLKRFRKRQHDGNETPAATDSETPLRTPFKTIPRPVPSRPDEVLNQNDPSYEGSPARAHAELGHGKVEPDESSKLEGKPVAGDDAHGRTSTASTAGTPARAQGTAGAETDSPGSRDGSRGGYDRAENAAASGQMAEAAPPRPAGSRGPAGTLHPDGTSRHGSALGTGDSASHAGGRRIGPGGETEIRRSAQPPNPSAVGPNGIRPERGPSEASAPHRRPLETLPGLQAEAKRGGGAGGARETSQGCGAIQESIPEPMGAGRSRDGAREEMPEKESVADELDDAEARAGSHGLSGRDTSLVSGRRHGENHDATGRPHPAERHSDGEPATARPSVPAVLKLQLLDVLAELRRLLPELAQKRRYRERMSGEVTTGLPGPLHHAFVDGFVQTQQADPPATLDDFRLIAEWVRAGGLRYLASSEWMAHLCKLPVVLEKATAWRDGGKKPIGKERGPPADGVNPGARALLEAIARRRKEQGNA